MTLDYIARFTYWSDMEAYLAEPLGSKTSLLYERVEKVREGLYVAQRKRGNHYDY